MLTGFLDIDDLRVGDLMHICHYNKDDRLGLILALKQDQRDKNPENWWTFVLFVWIIPQKELESQDICYQLAPGKTHILSNWCEILPFNYIQALPDCHIEADLSKIETGALLDVSRKSRGGYAVRSFEELGGCELSRAIRCVGEPLLFSGVPPNVC